MRLLKLILIAGLFAAIPAAQALENLTLTSPNGQITFTLERSTGNLSYRVAFRGKPVLEPSALGITVGGIPLARQAELGEPERYQTNETYFWIGNKSEAKDRCNGAKVPAKSGNGLSYTIEIRACDDGVAFRHIVPGQGARVPDEATTFRLPTGSTLWYHGLEDHYEAKHVRRGLRAVPPEQWMAPPVTVRLPGDGGYAAVTEAALLNYSGMVLQADEEGTLHARLGHAAPAGYPFRLRYPNDIKRLSLPAPVEGVITTPWRVVLIGADLNALVNADLVHNLAPPPDPKLFPQGLKTSWLKPGRSLWSYLDGGNNTVEGMKEWARLAHRLGFEYNLLEGFWSRWSEAELKELADYSRNLGVGLIIWKHSNQLRTPQSRQEFFDMCRRTGVAGVKIDFFDHEHKELIDLYETLLRMAAERQLLVDFHGCNKPTGLERTFPNLMGMEGIRGLESSPPWAQHDATLPFTRMLAGLADYTPMHFAARKMGDTTWAHQIANAILMPAPLLVFAAHPANILANPAVELIQSIPSTWDETIVLPQSSIGDIAAIARRKGKAWFLAVSNGPVARTLVVDLSFLGQGSYKSMLVRDGLEAASVKIEHMTARSSDTLYLDLRSGGGFVARFER